MILLQKKKKRKKEKRKDANPAPFLRHILLSECALKDTAHAGPQSAGPFSGGDPIAALSHCPCQPWAHSGGDLNARGGGSTAKAPLVNSLQWEDGSHGMMRTSFWEELPEYKIENGNNNRKIHSASLTVLYQETKVFTYNLASNLRSEWWGRQRWRQQRVGWATLCSLQGCRAILDFPLWNPILLVVRPSASPPCPNAGHRAAVMTPTSALYSCPHHSVPHRGTCMMFEIRSCFPSP